MNALWFLWKRTRINKMKMALKKPVTYIYIVFVGAYLFSLVFNLNVMFSNPSERTIAMLLTGFSLMIIPANLCSYAKRKGLLYKNSDVHFMFPSPLSPKSILIYAYFQATFTKMIICLGIMLVGIIACHVTPWKMLLYGFFSIIMQNSFEGSVAILLYGSERLSENARKMIRVAAWAVSASLLIVALLAYLKTGINAGFADELLNGNVLQFVPVIGWYAAIIHLILMGPTAVNLLGTGLYLIAWAILLTLAVRMKCRGEYYEDALKFAEDYEEAVSRQKKGQTVFSFGKKQKFGKAKVSWKGTGARALFYRQLLEYKKGRFFILNFLMVAHLLAGIAIAVLSVLEPATFSKGACFIIPGVGAYITFIFAAVNGKWTKELSSPYTYLIPDSTLKKLMNVTLIPILQNLICAVLITVPTAIVLGMSPIRAVLVILAGTIFSSSKLYAHAVADVVVGDILGVFGKQMLEMAALGITILLAVVGAGLGYLVSGEVLALILMNFFMLAYAVILVTIATLNFYFLEK